MIFGIRMMKGGKRRTPEQFDRNLKRAKKKLPGEIEKNLSKAAEYVIGQAKQEFQGERTRALYMIKGGRAVRRKNPRPVSSPPGKLGIFEGTYRKAITKRIVRSGRYIDALVGPFGIAYARRHEFGTGGMPKRPVLAPAIAKTQHIVEKLIGESFDVLDDT